MKRRCCIGGGEGGRKLAFCNLAAEKKNVSRKGAERVKILRHYLLTTQWNRNGVIAATGLANEGTRKYYNYVYKSVLLKLFFFMGSPKFNGKTVMGPLQSKSLIIFINDIQKLNKITISRGPQFEKHWFESPPWRNY